MMQSNLAYINPGGKQARKASALEINMVASRGLQEVLKTNLGPRGTMKMLVSGAGLIKITKDGITLLGEMQIQHPTAVFIARAATAVDDITGDGTTSAVLVIGEMMRQCERYIQDGLHPRILVEGFRLARDEALNFLKQSSVSIPQDSRREYLTNVAHSVLSTKVNASMTAQLAEAVVDSVLAIVPESGKEIDLHMVEVMHMRHRLSTDTRFVNGIVLDHGGRNDNMPKYLENAYILVCNVSLEYERSELNTGFYFKDPSEKAHMVAAERKITDDRVRDIIALKKQVCTKENKRSFVVINQKGIDPIALEMLSKEGILALRRCKRRNMERLVLACGGEAVNTTEGLTADVLGEAGRVQEYTLGDDKFTFVEDVRRGRSCTLLVKGPNDHTIAQIKDAIRDGLRAVKNAYENGAVIAGAGAFEVALHDHLMRFADTVTGKRKVGVRAYADAILIIPKTLAENSGLDVQQCLITIQEASREARQRGRWVGLRLDTGDPVDPLASGILDNVVVKKSLLETTGEIVAQLLLVDEIMKAGRRGAGGAPQQ
ncbi:putative TCP 1 cpn60 chaperonin family [Trypanosoma vivax]|uniref:Putative T-complex protein 1, zeta subunit n=1 Tax=Trypanosoma vivax (strain Y486) TaxID=1055687 RepID=G0UAL5_TRYVY|nr:t-complex protein 1 subunit zeta [Trypanosoma vivax]KAH8611922.1 putative TCP 1 cpn60 chaperonin family [Trypanosoma vivax]CCC52849.1 putative T-complex protein 1, zeta subunit [Trypanosoma vivax Y486]